MKSGVKTDRNTLGNELAGLMVIRLAQKVV